jgi:hypothetical protein
MPTQLKGNGGHQGGSVRQQNKDTQRGCKLSKVPCLECEGDFCRAHEVRFGKDKAEC